MTAIVMETKRPKRSKFVNGMLLALALAAALAAHGWETARDWYRGASLHELRVASAQTIDYAGARWRMTSLGQVATLKSGAAIMLAEFEATVADREAFAQLPCAVALVGADGLRWLPNSLLPDQVRKARPELVDLPTCGTAKVRDIVQGQPIRMRESFELPADRVQSVRFQLGQPPDLPDYLVFDRP